MWIVTLALRRPYTFVVMALLILILGIVAIRTMPTDIFPKIDIPVVSIIWQYSGLPPAQFEKVVTNSADTIREGVQVNVAAPAAEKREETGRGTRPVAHRGKLPSSLCAYVTGRHLTGAGFPHRPGKSAVDLDPLCALRELVL